MMKKTMLLAAVLACTSIFGGCSSSETAQSTAAVSVSVAEESAVESAASSTESATETAASSTESAAETAASSTESVAENATSSAETAASSTDTAAAEAAGTTLEDAKAAALAHAGVSEADVTYIKAEQDRDDGVEVYEVEFGTDSAEYDYEISVSTGEIIAYGYEMKGYAAASDDTALTEDEAKAAALAHTGVSEADLTYIKVEQDRDDGVQVYEVDFAAGTTEYEYEISAADGAILSYDVETK